MSKFGGAAKGAATGAVAGSAFGPWGTAAGALGGGIYGWLSDTSDEQADAEKKKLAGMQGAANVYQGYRPQAMGARQQGLNQTLSAYNGAGNAMGLMYGNSYNPSSYAPNLGKLPDPSSYAPGQAATGGSSIKSRPSEADLGNAAQGMTQDAMNASLIPPLKSGTPEVVRGRTSSEFALQTDDERMKQWADMFAQANGRPPGSMEELDAYAVSQTGHDTSGRKKNLGKQSA